MSKSTEMDVKTFMKKNRKIPVLNLNFKYITPVEYSKLTGRHVVTINKWLREGKIEGAIKIEGRWSIPIIPKTDLNEPVSKLISEDYAQLLLENERLRSIIADTQQSVNAAI